MTDRKHITPAPAIWERLLAAATSLFAIVIVPPIALLLGSVSFFIFRRRAQFPAYFGILLAMWQCVVILLGLLIGRSLSVLAFQTHTDPGLIKQYFLNMARLVLGQPYNSTYLHCWSAFSMPVRLGLIMVFTVFVLNIAVGIWGTIAAVRGRTMRLPVLNRISASFLPRTN